MMLPIRGFLRETSKNTTFKDHFSTSSIFCIAFNAFNKPLRLLHNRTFSTKSQELAIIGEYQLPEGCRYSVSRSGCEVQSHHRGLMKTSNFRREIRKTYYRNDPVKYDLIICHLLIPSSVRACCEDQLLH